MQYSSIDYANDHEGNVMDDPVTKRIHTTRDVVGRPLKNQTFNLRPTVRQTVK